MPFLVLLLCTQAGAASSVTAGKAPPWPRPGSAITGNSAHAVNEGMTAGGLFRIDGAPRGYEPGKTYPIKVTIGHPGLSRWGFELSARFSESGTQAGHWTPLDGTTQVHMDAGVEYATHAASGSQQGRVDGPVDFFVKWTAPDTASGLVVFSAAGSAADGSGAPEGEFVYTAGNFSRPAEAAPQDPPPVEVDAAPVKEPARQQETSRIVDLPSPVDMKRGTVEIMIQHRFLQAIKDAGAGEAFGIDSGANISLGFNYGVTDRISAGIARSRFDQVVELAGTYEIHTAKESNWKVAVRGGVEGKRNFHDEYSPFLQLVSSVDYRRFRLNVVPTMIFNSRSEALMEFNRARAINPDSNHTFALGFGADVALNPRYSVAGEYVPRLAGFGGLDERRDQVSGGVVIRTWGHVFSVFVATSRDFTPAKYGVNAEDRSLSLGFNLYRRIR